MKKILVLAAAAALAACSNPHADRYVIEGQVPDLTGVVYLLDASETAIDSAAVENGRFRLEGEIACPEISYLVDALDGAQTFAQMLFLEPGTITVTTDTETENTVVGGTPSNDGFTAYGQRRMELIREYRDPETSEERRNEVDAEIDALGIDTYNANVGNLFGAMLLQSEMSYVLSGSELLDEIAKFPAAMQEGELLTAIREYAEKKARVDIGATYVDIAQPAPDGEVVSLKSVIENPANKYTLLDFWATWCPPCMREVPYLVKTYNEFHDKGFEIYGVSFDRPGDHDKWAQVIRERGMNWIHVSTLTYFDNEGGKAYAVQAIPTNYLIDANGTIVARNLRGDEVYEKIAELLGE